MFYAICCCALSCSFLLGYFIYCWLMGRRDEALGHLGSIGISILALSVSLIVFNAEVISRLAGIPVYALDPEIAIDRVQHLVNVVQDRMRFLTGIMLSLTYAELLAMVVGCSTGGAPPVSGVSSTFIMARLGTSFSTGMLKGLMYCYNWIMLLSIIILELLRVCSRLGISMLTFGSCLLPAPRIRRLGILLIAWGLIFTYALPAAVNLSQLPRELSELKIEKRPPESYGVLYTEVKAHRKGIPFVMVILKDQNYGQYHVYQLNRFAKKLILIPLGRYRLTSLNVYWLSFSQDINLSISYPLYAPIRDHATEKTKVSDGILYYEGIYDSLEVNLPGDFLFNSSGVYGWGCIVGGPGRISILSISTNGSLTYTLYFFVNSSRTIFLIGSRPRVEIIGYYVNGSWLDRPVNFTLDYEVTKSSIKELKNYYNVSWIDPDLLHKLYNNYVSWYSRQYWLDERTLREIWKYYPQYPDPRVFIRPPMDEIDFLRYTEYRPPVYRVSINCTQIANSTASPKWFASLRIEMPPGKAWIFQPWMFYNPYTKLNRDIWNSRNIGLFTELNIAGKMAESVLRNFIILLLAADVLSGMFGGISVTGWIAGVVWDRVLGAYVMSTIAFIVGIGRAVYRSKAFNYFSKLVGLKVIARLEPSFRAAKRAVEPWRRTSELGMRRVEVWATALEESLRNIRSIRLRKSISKGLVTTGQTLRYTSSILKESTLPGIVKIMRDFVGLKHPEKASSRGYRLLDKVYSTMRITPLGISTTLGRRLHPLFVKEITRMRMREVDLTEVLKMFKGTLVERRLLEEVEKELSKYVEALENRTLVQIKEELLRGRPELKVELEKIKDFYTLSKITSKYDTALDAITRYAGTVLDLYRDVKISSLEEVYKIARDLDYLNALGRSIHVLAKVCREENISSPLEVLRILEERIALPPSRNLEIVRRVMTPIIYRLAIASPEEILKSIGVDIRSIPSSMDREGFEKILEGLRSLVILEKLKCILTPLPDPYTRMRMLEEISLFVDRVEEYTRLKLLDPRRAAEVCSKTVLSVSEPERARGLIGEISLMRREIAEAISNTTDLSILKKIGIESRDHTLDECILFYKDFGIDEILDVVDRLRLLVENMLSIDQTLAKYIPTGIKLLESEVPSAYDLVSVASELRRCARVLAIEAATVEPQVRKAIIPVVEEARSLASIIEEHTILPIPSFIFGPTVDEILKVLDLSIPRSLLLIENKIPEEYNSELVRELILSENREILEEINRRGWLLVYLVSTVDEKLASKILTVLELGGTLDDELIEELKSLTKGMIEGDFKWLWYAILDYGGVRRGELPLDTVMMIPELRQAFIEVAQGD